MVTNYEALKAQPSERSFFDRPPHNYPIFSKVNKNI